MSDRRDRLTGMMGLPPARLLARNREERWPDARVGLC
jgi:hypothetical protein